MKSIVEKPWGSYQVIEEGTNYSLKKLIIFKEVLRKSAVKYKDTFQIGRSHGVHAEPIPFGLKNALWSEEIKRNIIRCFLINKFRMTKIEFILK